MKRLASFDEAALAAAIELSEPGFDVAPGICPWDATQDPTDIVVDLAGTVGDDLELCADPERKVWTLTVVNGGAPDISEPVSTPVGPAPYHEQVLADGPAGYWRFSETSGTAVADSSNNGRGAFVSSSPAALRNQPSLLASSQDPSVSFDGSGEGMVSSYHAALAAAWPAAGAPELEPLSEGPPPGQASRRDDVGVER